MHPLRARIARRIDRIAISAARHDPAMPDVPTIAETVPGFEMAPWWGLFAPAGTPRDMVTRLNTETVRIPGLPDQNRTPTPKGVYSRSGRDPVVNLKEKFSIPAPPDEVWPLMSDPAVVAACIPGAELTELTPDGAHRGKVTFKFGPTVAVFRGETRLTYDHPVKRCVIEARGIDQKGASRARARFEVEARGVDTTDVTMEGGFEVAGPLEMFASAGGVHVARALLAEFATNIANVIERRRAKGGDAVLEPAPAASGTKIVGRALLDGARGVVGKMSGKVSGKNDKGSGE